MTTLRKGKFKKKTTRKSNLRKRKPIEDNVFVVGFFFFLYIQLTRRTNKTSSIVVDDDQIVRFRARKKRDRKFRCTFVDRGGRGGFSGSVGDVLELNGGRSFASSTVMIQ